MFDCTLYKINKNKKKFDFFIIEQFTYKIPKNGNYEDKKKIKFFQLITLVSN